MIAAVVCACLTAQATNGASGRDAELSQRITAELRAWYAAALDRGAAEDGGGERHRIELLRLWPHDPEGLAWLADLSRLRRLFAGCFVYGKPEPDAFADLPGVEVHLPAGYDPAVPTPAVLQVRPRLESEPADSAGRAIVIRSTPARLYALLRPPRPPTTLEIVLAVAHQVAWPTPAARLVAFARALARGAPEQAPDEEIAQRGLFLVFGSALRRLNVDRDRVILDGAGSACRTVLRAATSAPDRFAAVVLHEPNEVPAVGYQNLAGVPVLVLSSEPGGEIAAGLRRRIGEVSDGRCELRDARRFTDAQVAEWRSQRRRRLLREQVRLVMRLDGAVDGYWISGISADLGTRDSDDEAWIHAIADRSAARITVRSQRIERFTLLLNDELIDLDREFTLVVNDVEVTLRRSRSLSFLGQTVLGRFDPGFLFTTALAIDVPRRG